MKSRLVIGPTNAYVSYVPFFNVLWSVQLRTRGQIKSSAWLVLALSHLQTEQIFTFSMAISDLNMLI